MAVRSKAREYAVNMDRGAGLSIAGVDPLPTTASWTPEHLLLAALSRCAVASLSFHALRAQVTVAAEVDARGTIARRDTDGRYAFTCVALTVAVDVEPLPAAAALDVLIRNAERDCFVGASLQVIPEYEWIINGSAVIPRS